MPQNWYIGGKELHMKRVIEYLSLIFAAGVIGGLANSIALWGFGQAGITTALGVKLAPTLTPAWLYPRLVWGGIWGFLFLLPFWRHRPFSKGVLLSLGPTLVQLLVVFPMMANKGMYGLALGTFTPLFVVFFNAVWGVFTGLWISIGRP
jgi:hypothetical protein